MNLIVIIGSGAVGKMTVGQELMKITDYRLFHNHMAIEPVIEIFGYFNGSAVAKIREAVFDEFIKSDNEGMIFTYMWAFDARHDWDYVEHVKSIFAPYGTQFYYVELIAPQEVRLARNATQNRLKHKPSKRDLESSNRMLIEDDKNYRCVSNPGEIPFENYLRIENDEMSADDTAALIQRTFGL